MAASHMVIENIILMKRYVRHLLFNGARLCVEYVGGKRMWYNLEYEPTTDEVAAWETELEDR